VIEVVDAQVHAWARDSDEFPWRLDFGSAEKNRQVAAHFEAETMPPGRLLACMDEAGVDAAVLVSPTMYGADAGYARHTVAHDPARLAYVGLVDPASTTVEQDVSGWRSQTGALAIRVPIYSAATIASVESGPLRAVLAAAERHGVPVCVYPPGYLDRLESIVRSFPGLQFVIDHLGLAQPSPVFPTVEGDGFERLPELLRLAAYSNVAVKATGVPSLSQEDFPFRDVWDPLRRVIDAFGCDRVMWGTDFTRVERASYSESVAYLGEIDGLAAADLERLYGATLRRVLGWPR
jgi:predicted TIM-barrel fold metal-dependent hydrolase